MNTNRELKFRTWYKDQMVYSDNYGTTEHLYEFFEIPAYDMNNVMQYTGLKDKHGNEIYEGDIVSVIDDNNIFVVKFGKVFRDIVGHDTNTVFPVELNTFYFESEGRAYFSITKNSWGKHDLEDTIIIGNIFENKGLLK